MPSRCCVTNCKGNYDGEKKVSVFKFPDNEELRQRWLRSIPRDNFTPTKASRVCEAHFCSSDIERVSEIFDSTTGKKVSVPLAHPRLVPSAVPTQFLGCPSYLSSGHQARESLDMKRLRLENQAFEKALIESVKEKEAYDAKIKISSWVELCLKVDSMNLSNYWSVIKNADMLIFSHVEMQPAPVIVASAVIAQNLKLTVFIGNVKVYKTSKSYVFPETINDMNQLTLVLENLKLLDCKSSEILPNFYVLNEMLKTLGRNIEGMSNVTTFLREQISLLYCKKESRRYSSEMLVFSSLLYSISPHSYRFLMSSQNIVLPYPTTLRRLISRFPLNPKCEQQESGFLSYIKCKFPALDPSDHKVILMMDEIHIKPFFDFKGGSIFGASYDTKNAATTAYVFMIQSLLSKFKDVVHILPVSKISADDLFIFLKKIVVHLENIGFMVITVVSDNNSINRKAMSYFSSPPELSIVYKHPVDPSRPLFFCIDTVHILKCIRNNWINQKNSGQCFFYPEFAESLDSEGKMFTASFNTLKQMHQFESEENLIKYGYGLTLKALNPSNLERQNVKLALKIFSRYVAERLRKIGQKHNLVDSSSTANFIQIICNWFEIVNVKTPNKGKRLRNAYEEPMTMAENDERRIFLENFLNWLDRWNETKCTTGTFTKETRFASAHSTHCLRELCRYCIEELGFKYFLPGKIQTDILENRFGRYRQLSGSNYNISITQVLESEAKLRMQDFLPLTIDSSKFGRIEIANFQEEEPVDDSDMSETEYGNLNLITVTEADLNAIKVLPVITYLAGYCIYKLLRKFQCKSCSSNLSLDKRLDLDISYSFIRNLDRGGLLCPHPDIVLAVSFNYIVIKKLLSEVFEEKFLKAQGQRNIAANLTYDILIERECLMFDQCVDGHSLEAILKYVLNASTNTFLKNYCAHKNDVKKSNQVKKRKLQTLSKPIV